MTKIGLCYERNYAWLDVILSILVVASSYWARMGGLEIPAHEFRGQVMPLLLTTSVSLLGFVITGMTLLGAFPAQMAFLERRGHGGEVHAIFMRAVWSLAVTAFFSLGAMLLEGMPGSIFTFVTAWGAVLSVFRLGRIVWLLEEFGQSKRISPRQ